MTSYGVELKQTLYWEIEIEIEGEHEIEDMIDNVEMSMLPELNEHYTFANHEEREAKVLTMNGEKYEF